MKRSTKQFVIIIFIVLMIFIISFVLEDKTLYMNTSILEEQPAVYITEHGDCYHSVDCHYLSRSKIEQGLYEAKAKGYRECSYCNGYSNNVVQVEIIKYYEATDYTNAFLFSSLRALLITPVLYIIVFCILEQKNTNQEEDKNDRT